MHHPTDRITHTTAFVAPVVEHWLEREIAQWVHPHEGSIRRPIAPWANALPLSYVPLPNCIAEREKIYGYMASDMWLRTILIVRKETRCRHIGYSYRLTALAGTRNSSMGPPHEGSIRRPIAPRANTLPLSYAPLLLHSNVCNLCTNEWMIE